MKIDLLMYSAQAELAVDCLRTLLITYAVYDLSQYCIRTTSDPANPLLGFTSDYLGELARYIYYLLWIDTFRISTGDLHLLWTDTFGK